jgi:hypothetical protein
LEPNSGAALTIVIVLPTVVVVVVRTCCDFTAFEPYPQKLFPALHTEHDVAVNGPLSTSKLGVTSAETVIACVDLTTGEVTVTLLTEAAGKDAVPAANAKFPAIMASTGTENGGEIFII